jgi:hypothetical protein
MRRHGLDALWSWLVSCLLDLRRLGSTTAFNAPLSQALIPKTRMDVPCFHLLSSDLDLKISLTVLSFRYRRIYAKIRN